MNTALESLIDDHEVLICAGAGGVGKTTTAAALALAGARRGKRACVVTIDPARRLADALDIEANDGELHRIDGDFPGELYAVMLDAKATFDHLIDENAQTTEQAERIRSNRLYRNLVSALAGTQEYMATEKLYELHQSGRFDLIVVDTPPTRFALDFLDAPSRLAGFLDNKIFRLLITPGRAYLKALSVASQLLLKTIARIAGSEIVEDTIAFFQAFDGIEQGFKDRASAVETLLATEGTGFVLVCTPMREAIDQAEYFASRLHAQERSIHALIVNRAIPDFGAGLDSSLEDDHRRDGQVVQELMTNLRELHRVALREHGALGELRQNLGDPSTFVVPLLAGDVHDLAALELVVSHLSNK